MVGYIYLIIDTTNGMKYTGKHHYHIEGQLDPNYHGSGTIIKNIYKKRPETLKEEYIKTCYSEEEMNSDEQHYIEVFDTLWPNGYNLTEGGDGCVACEETRIKISNSNKGKKRSEETRRKMSLAKKGKPSPNKGKTMSEETKKKISESLKGRTAPNKGTHISEETRKKISEAQKGIQHSEETKKKISESLKGKPKSEEHKKKLSESIKGKTNIKLSKTVLQFTLDGVFIREWPSAAECGRNGFSQSAVSSCCNGKLPHYKGFKWMYADDYIE